MEAAFDGAQGDGEHVGDFLVGEAVEVGHEQDFAEVVGHGGGAGPDSFAQFLLFELVLRHGEVGLHEVEELDAVLTVADAGGEGGGVALAAAAQVVAGLVGGDGEEPGLEPAGDVERFDGLMNLEERLLKDVLGGIAVAHEADEEVEELVAIARDQRFKGVILPLAEEVDEFFIIEVGGGLVGVGRNGSWGLGCGV